MEPHRVDVDARSLNEEGIFNRRDIPDRGRGRDERHAVRVRVQALLADERAPSASHVRPGRLRSLLHILDVETKLRQCLLEFVQHDRAVTLEALGESFELGLVLF